MDIDKSKFLRSLIAVGLLGGAACAGPEGTPGVAAPTPGTAGAEAVPQKAGEEGAADRPVVIVQPIQAVPVPVPVEMQPQEQQDIEEQAKPGEQEGEQDLAPTRE